MNALHSTLTKKRHNSEADIARQSELQMPGLNEMEELYWLAVALTGDPELAASLVVDTAKLKPSCRGVFHN